MEEINSIEISDYGDVEEEEGEDLVQVCYGEHGSQEKCSACPDRKDCKKFTETEKKIVRKYKGKYTGTGKFVEKDKY